MGMLESRIRILTNNTQTPILSPQEVVSCSKYAQGKGYISELCYELFGCMSANITGKSKGGGRAEKYSVYSQKSLVWT